MEDGRSTEIDEFDDIAFRHDAVIKLEITVSEADRVQILHAIAYLAENAVNLRSTHLAGHDDTEQVERRILHDLFSEAAKRTQRQTHLNTDERE